MSNAPRAIIETCLYVKDLDRAKRFYCDVLSLELHSELEERHLFFRVGRGMLLLFIADRTDDEDASLPRHGTRSNTHIAFEIGEDEVDMWKEKLSSKGDEIEKEHLWPTGGVSLYFRDPSGNSLEVTTAKTWGIDKV